MTADIPTTTARVVVTDYQGPGAGRSAYRLAREIAGEHGQIVVVHPLDPMLNFFGAVSEDVDGDGTVLDQIDHRIVIGEDLGIRDEHLPVTVAPADL